MPIRNLKFIHLANCFQLIQFVKNRPFDSPDVLQFLLIYCSFG